MEPKTDDEIKQMALDLRAGRIFTDRDLPKEDAHLLTSVFIILGLLDNEAIAEIKNNPPAMIYEYMSEAGPRSVNGYPMFMSMKMLSKEDMPRLIAVFERLAEAEKTALAT